MATAISKQSMAALRKAHVRDPDANTTIGIRRRALEKADAIAQQASKAYSIIRINSDESSTALGGYSTGYAEIDDVLSGATNEKGESIRGSGVGFPRGRMIEIFGPESTAKTTLSLLAIADCQRKGGVAAFCDAEHALDLAYARMLGVDVDALLINEPDTAEETINFVESMVEKGVNLVVIDSVAAMVPKKELEGEAGDSVMGIHARLMSQACRKINARLKAAWGGGGEEAPTVIWINQIRQKIGVMFGNPETTTGGNALKFYASIRVDLRLIKRIMNTVKGRKVNQGVLIRARTIKNKVVPPFREVVFKILFHGPDRGMHIPTDAEVEAYFKKQAKED